MKRLGSLKLFFALEDAEGMSRGSVVIPRRGTSSNVYSTIYDALRSRTEILYRYGVRQAEGRTELGELDAMRDSLGEVHVALIEGEPKDLAGRVFKGLAANLRRTRDPMKVQARRKAEAGPVTNAGRVNPGATRARATAVDRRLADRQQRVRDIVPWIGAMENALFMEIDRSVGVFAAIDRAAGVMLQGHAFFKGGSVSKNQLNGIRARLRIVFDELQTLDASPFIAYANSIAPPVASLDVALQSGNSTAAVKSLAAVRSIAGRALFQRKIEEAITGLTLMPQHIRARIDALWKEGVNDSSLEKTGVGLDLYAALAKCDAGDLETAKAELKSASKKCVP